MRKTRLLWFGVALIGVAALGALITEGPLPGGMGWTDHMRSRNPMMWSGEDTTDARPPLPDATEVTVTADEFRFSPAIITVDQGTPVNVTLDNTGAAIHDLTIPNLEFRIVADPGGRATGGLVADEPGSYPFECSIPGHAQAGMTGTLHVTAVA